MLIKKMRWPPKTTTGHARRKGRMSPSPPNRKIASAKVLTWSPVAERSRPPRAPRTDDFKMVMESPCPFHPKGKHTAKDCFTLKKYVEKHSRRPACNQDDSDRNKD